MNTLVSLVSENNALGASRWIEQVLQEKTSEAIEQKRTFIVEALYGEAVAPEGQRPEKFKQTDQAKRFSLRKRNASLAKKVKTIRQQIGSKKGNNTSGLDLAIASMQRKRTAAELSGMNTNHKNT